VPAAATLADSVAVVPAQMVALVKVTTGFGFTVTLVVAVDEQVPYADDVNVTE
jgi:hypothetical protein